MIVEDTCVSQATRRHIYIPATNHKSGCSIKKMLAFSLYATTVGATLVAMLDI